MFNEIKGDLFEQTQADAIVITTNGVVMPGFRAVMGAGVAKQAKLKWPGIDLILGYLVKMVGNRTHRLTYTESKLPPILRLSWMRCTGWPHGEQDIFPSYQVPYHIVALPTKHDWRDHSSLPLIKTGLEQLVEETEKQGWDEVILVQPGTGLGGLSWEKQVKPLCQELLDERFLIISPK